jgi:WD40 repeat protein
VHVWDLTDGRKVRHLPGEPDQLTVLAFSPDGGVVAIPQGNDVRQLELSSGQEVGRLRGHTARLTALA